MIASPRLVQVIFPATASFFHTIHAVLLFVFLLHMKSIGELLFFAMFRIVLYPLRASPWQPWQPIIDRCRLVHTRARWWCYQNTSQNYGRISHVSLSGQSPKPGTTFLGNGNRWLFLVFAYDPRSRLQRKQKKNYARSSPRFLKNALTFYRKVFAGNLEKIYQFEKNNLLTLHPSTAEPL